MKKHLLFFTLIGFSLLSSAQTNPSDKIAELEAKAAKEFNWLDRNRDKKLSPSELYSIPNGEELLQKADSNHDGFLSFEEIRQYSIKLRVEEDRKNVLTKKSLSTGVVKH